MTQIGWTSVLAWAGLPLSDDPSALTVVEPMSARPQRADH
jgi:hypothetical protein